MPTWMTVGLVVLWLVIAALLLVNAIDPRSIWEMSAQVHLSSRTAVSTSPPAAR
jgi:hypothetical protein